MASDDDEVYDRLLLEYYDFANFRLQQVRSSLRA